MQKELKASLEHAKKQDIRNPVMTYLDKEEIFETSPLFKKYFTDMKKDHHKFTLIKVTLTPSYQHHPHIDNLYLNQTAPVPPDQTHWCLAFNFPIENCDDTFTAFYKCTGPDTIIHETILPKKPQYGTYRKLEKSQLVEIDRYYLTRPVVINSSVPHNINNNDYSVRISLNVRLSPDPWDIVQ